MTAFANDFPALARHLIPLARQAGAVILPLYQNPGQVTYKADESPVTVADQRAEAVILPGLETLTPGVPIVAEEAVAAGSTPDISGGTFWLVDPLDGTKEFIAQRSDFTVNIALIVDGQPVIGLVYAPPLGEIYVALSPSEAVLITGGGDETPLKTRALPADGVNVVASRSHTDDSRMQAYLEHFQVAGYSPRGSSLKFCEIARGAADLYPRFGPTSEWDTAAGQAVLVAAGGKVVTLDGQPLSYGRGGPDLGWLNPAFIAAAGAVDLPEGVAI